MATFSPDNLEHDSIIHYVDLDFIDATFMVKILVVEIWELEEALDQKILNANLEDLDLDCSKNSLVKVASLVKFSNFHVMEFEVIHHDLVIPNL